MSISQELKQKLAKAARDLADEIEAGKGPKFGWGMTFYEDETPCCAMGHVYHRAGIGESGRQSLGPTGLLDVAYPVEEANDARRPGSPLSRLSRPLPGALRDYAFAVEGL